MIFLITYLNNNIFYIALKGGETMIIMIGWWVLIGIILLLFLVNHFLIKNKIKKRKIDDTISLLSILQIFVIIMAIATKNPIFEMIGLPKEYEWLGGILTAGFIVWVSYLNPLKNRVIEVEKDTREIKTEIKNIKEDTGIIKDKIINDCQIKPKKI